MKIICLTEIFILFLCGLFEPMKYGLPAAGFQTALLFIQVKLQWVDLTLWRWLIVSICISGLSVLLYRSKAVGRFTFRVAWFSGLNVLIASSIATMLLIIALGGFLMGNEVDIQERVYVAFQEFFGVMSMGLLALTLFSLLVQTQNSNNE